MRIISKFIDYYDSVSGVMYDSSILYKRDEQVIENVVGKSSGIFLTRHSTRLGFVGFCGKVYPLLKVTLATWKHEESIRNDKKTNHYTKYLVNDKNHTNLPTYIFYDLSVGKEFKDSFDNGRLSYFENRNIGSYAKESIEQDLQPLFDKYDVPIFIAIKHHREYKITLNGCLKDVNFQTVIDAYTTYQELVMWFNNKAVNEDIPQIKDDKILRDQKGFDDWSFKKLPTKKR